MATHSKTLLFFVCTLFATEALTQTNNCGWRLQPPLQILNSKAAKAGYLPFNVNSTANKAGADTIYTLPVVVHVIHTGTPVGAADNPDDSHINNMLQTLNNAWRKNGNNYGGADMGIQFKLATRSPGCGATNGINRVNGSSIPNYTTGGITNYNNPLSAPETEIKNLSRWPNTDYINIWIVNKINGNELYPGGYAYFPEYNSALTDGIVLNASVVDSANKTIAHEMGHMFYLYHTFTDGAYDTACANNTDCATQGDMICDTEPYLNGALCSDNINTCTNLPFTVADANKGYTVLNNYMGYTNCQWMFTSYQRARVRAALLAFRPGLIQSGALNTDLPVATPATPCIPSVANGLSPYYGVQEVRFNTIHVYSNSSQADGAAYIDRTCNQFTNVTKGVTYALTITGSYLNPHRIKAFLDYNNNGNFSDAGELLLSTYDGSATANITVPLSGVVTNKPLRLRIIADNPALPEPTACILNGSVAEGAGQVEDYGVVIGSRQVSSVKSGAWNDASTWNCNCIPGGDDQVTITATHTVNATIAMGALQCGNLIVLPAATFNTDGNVQIITGN